MSMNEAQRLEAVREALRFPMPCRKSANTADDRSPTTASRGYGNVGTVFRNRKIKL